MKAPGVGASFGGVLDADGGEAVVAAAACPPTLGRTHPLANMLLCHMKCPDQAALRLKLLACSPVSPLQELRTDAYDSAPSQSGALIEIRHAALCSQKPVQASSRCAQIHMPAIFLEDFQVIEEVQCCAQAWPGRNGREVTWQCGLRRSVMMSQVLQCQALTLSCVMASARCCSSSFFCMLPSSRSIFSASSSSTVSLYLCMGAAFSIGLNAASASSGLIWKFKDHISTSMPVLLISFNLNQYCSIQEASEIRGLLCTGFVHQYGRTFGHS